ncbi:phage baseplate assembly protein V [Balnearium lithotrophicum]|uniref:Phage baseplate assembly protein V n=1 Tax=Balnearium lithotrophicum TaxID=223788 RepID=A0A521DS59_9BACT|nr:phage baseplate assembly protein V [Balnearium lithotrophicum]SMO74556.1 phage baseplate assembly protein V [Balnearium lithotrophicum]
MTSQIEKLFQLVMNIVKVGIVKHYNPENHTAVVEFKDFDCVVSRELQIAETFTYQNKTYFPLREGQKVICLLLPQSGTTDGFIIGTVYDEDNQPPVKDENKFHVKFEDGTVLEYDTANHKLYADVKGNVEIEVSGHMSAVVKDDVLIKSSSQITLQAPAINLQNNSPTIGFLEGDFRIVGSLTVEGNVEVDGNLHATGSIIDEGGNTPHHTH